MIFLPNSFERYAASLRLYLQISVLRDGEQTKHIKMLNHLTLYNLMVTFLKTINSTLS